MARYVGCDVHREKVVVCIMDDQGAVVARTTIAATKQALEEFAGRQLTRQDHLALEATFNCWAVKRILQPFVAEVVISNPLTTKAIAQSKIKTDKVDAEVLAQLLRCDFLPRVWTPDEETEELRALTSRRASLVSECTRLKNRIRGVLAQELIPRYAKDLFNGVGQQWLAEQPVSPRGRRLIESDARLLSLVQAELIALEQGLIEKAHARDDVRLLMTLPGVDVVVALGLVAALGDIRRFATPQSACKYLGLVPSIRQTGTRCHHGPITKQGNSHARWLIIQSAQHLRNNPGPLGFFYRRLRRKKNHSVAVVACARKLVVIAWHLLTSNEPYRYAQPRATQDKLARLRIKATGHRKKSRPAAAAQAPANRSAEGPTRVTPALRTVCTDAGLPAVRSLEELPPGEIRALKAQGVMEYVTQIQQEQRRPRKRSSAAETAVAGG
jgi:transposase